MTYARFLALFLVPPLALALVLAWRFVERRHLVFLGGLSAVVLAWTSPWDNAAVRAGLWSFSPERVSGVVLGVLPLEEYAFFLLQSWVVSLLSIWWLRR